MIIIYTFEFKKNAPFLSMNEEYMMLVVSIQSAIESHGKMLSILIYSGDIIFIKRISAEFGNKIQIIFVNKQKYCDNEKFTCAGHTRVPVLNDIVGHVDDDILYVDNDTLFKPGGIDILQQHYKKPGGYRLETWNTLENWINMIVTDETQNKQMKSYCARHLTKHICNNGVQYYPKSNYQSVWLAQMTYKHYMNMLKIGYSHGLDMLAFSFALYDVIQPPLLQFQNLGQIDVVWHSYAVKPFYIKNLKQIDAFSEHTLNHKKNNIYEKLDQLYKSSV